MLDLVGFSSIFFIVLCIFILVVIAKSIAIVPQQNAWVIERLGKYDRTLAPGLGFCLPFIERVAYKHSLKECVLDVPPQLCITKDNTQLRVDGVLYFQVTDPQRASYGSDDYMEAITQLAQTVLRSQIGKLELDKTFEEREAMNTAVVDAVDKAARNWGIKMLRYEVKDLTPPEEILRAMQSQITAEREKRAVIAASEGKRQEAINLAEGAKASAIARSEGEKQSAINNAEGEAEAIRAVAIATADAIEKVAEATQKPGGMDAVNMNVAEKYVAAFANLAQEGNTLILPANMSDMGGLIASAMTVMKATK